MLGVKTVLLKNKAAPFSPVLEAVPNSYLALEALGVYQVKAYSDSC